MKVLYGFLAFVLLLVIAAFLAPIVIDWNSYKPEISERFEALTGRSLAIDGDIDITILPTPKLRISNVRFANIEGAKAKDMARLRALDLKLELGPLLSGDFQLSSLKLIDPVIELERLDDGRENWKFEPANEGSDETRVVAGSKTREAELAAFSFNSMSIVNGTLIYRDSASAQIEYIQNLNISLSAKSLHGPFRSEGSMKVRGIETEFQFASGRKRADGHVPVSLKAELGDGLAQLGFDGKLEIGQRSSEGSGTLRASGDNLTDLINALGTSGARQLASEKFFLKTEVSLSPSGIALDEFQFRVGETQARGTVAYKPKMPEQLEATLTINRLDLDKITENGVALKSQTDDAPAVGSKGEDSSDSLTGATKVESKFSSYLSMLPVDFSATLDLAIQTLRYRGSVVQQAHTIVSLDDGFITVQQASALLPGGSNAALFGQLSPGENGPRFDGQLEMMSHDVRAVISWLNLMELNGIPSDRLRSFSLATGFSIGEQGGELSDLKLTIDASHLKGFANFAFGSRNIIDANLHLDQLNADAYLNNDYALSTTTGGGSGTDKADAADGPAPTKSGLAILDNLEAKLKLTAERLSYGGATLSGISLKSAIRDKVLTVEMLDIADLLGAKLLLNGEIRDLTGEPDVNLVFNAQTESILGLTRLAGVATSFHADNFGTVHLSGTLSGGREAVNLNARLNTRLAEILLIGSIDDPLADTSLNLGFEMRAPDPAELLRACDITPPKMIHRLGPLAIDGGLDGGLEALNMSLSAHAASNHLRVIGNLANFFNTGHYNLAFDLINPSFTNLAKLLSSEPYAGAEVGEVRIKGRLAGNDAAAKLSDLRLALGNTHISGSADVMLDGPLPLLTAVLDASLLDAGLFIGSAMASENTAHTDGSEGSRSGSAAKGTDQPRRKEGERWSNEAFDLALLAEFEADISIVAEALIAGGYRFDQAELKFRVTGGTLKIDSLRGRIFDGLIEAQGSIAGAAPPKATLAFKLDNVDLAAALRKAGDIDAVTGRADVDGRFTSEGYSERDMVRTLQGAAMFNAENGTIESLDLRALSDQLGNLHTFTNLHRFASEELLGGATRLDSLKGTIQVINGLAITNDLILLIDGGRGTVRGNADLPRWLLDLTAIFQLTDHPKASPVGVRMTGSIDSPTRELLLADTGDTMLPKLREGAKAEPGSFEDTVLRGIFGNPENSAPSRITMPPPVDSNPALAPKQGDNGTPSDFAPQQGDYAPEPTPDQASMPSLKKIPERAKSDPLSPQDILRGVLGIQTDQKLN